jgi:hypothetical protein
MTVSKEAPLSDMVGPGRVDAKRITDDEMAYHSRLVERTQWARSVAAQVQEVEAAFNSWAAFLRERYDLKPGDRVAEDGTITRTQHQTQLSAA